MRKGGSLARPTLFKFRGFDFLHHLCIQCCMILANQVSPFGNLRIMTSLPVLPKLNQAGTSFIEIKA